MKDNKEERPKMLRIKVKLILLCSLIVLTNTKTSTKWQLNPVTKKIEYVKVINNDSHYNNYDLHLTSESYSQDHAFYIIVTSEQANTFNNHGPWLRKSPQISFETLEYSYTESTTINENEVNEILINDSQDAHNNNDDSQTLLCGQPNNYTQYDYIINIDMQSKRNKTKFLPEPEVAYFFIGNQDKIAYDNFNINDLEKRLRKAKRENPLSAKVYHHLGNYWRIKGNAAEAVKCFRRSLDIMPTESEVMFNLGKVLFNLQYLDDAIHIIRRSIEYQSHSHAIWRHYFLLGEILRVYGDNRASIHYYRLALQLNPSHELLAKTVKNFSLTQPNTKIHIYTVFIIVTLVIAVLIIIVLSPSMSNDGLSANSKTFHRINMRRLKAVSVTSRTNRLRKF